MATCKDCFHYEPCFSGGASMWNNIEQTPEDCCQYFVREVVVCKDCVHFVKRDEKPHFCFLRRRHITENDFCSDGIKKE